MKTSEQATNYLLVKANTNSEWDYCSFAIVHISKNWKIQLQERIEFLNQLEGDCHFMSMTFYDTSVDFYGLDDDGLPNIDYLLGKRLWAYVDLKESELENLTVPENKLCGYTLNLHANGSGNFSAYGKHTNEEFWTEEISFNEIV